MFYWHKRLLVKHLLHEQMLCSLKHLMLVWWHKGEPTINSLHSGPKDACSHTLHTLRLKLLRKICVPNSCWTGQPVQGTGPSRCSFTHTDCISHLNQGHSPCWEPPGNKSWPRDLPELRWGLCQWLTSARQSCPLWAAQSWANLQLPTSTSSPLLSGQLCLHSKIPTAVVLSC